MLIVNQEKNKISENLEISIIPIYKNHEEVDYYKVVNENILLGEYRTEERAKEVLQEIVEKYSSYLKLKGGPAVLQGQIDIQPNIFNIPKVYIMPKE